MFKELLDLTEECYKAKFEAQDFGNIEALRRIEILQKKIDLLAILSAKQTSYVFTPKKSNENDLERAYNVGLKLESQRLEREKIIEAEAR